MRTRCVLGCWHCWPVTRYGTRKKKCKVVRLWRCASCKRRFTPAPTQQDLSRAHDHQGARHVQPQVLTRGNAAAREIKTGGATAHSILSQWIAEHWVRLRCASTRTRRKTVRATKRAQWLQEVRSRCEPAMLIILTYELQVRRSKRQAIHLPKMQRRRVHVCSDGKRLRPSSRNRRVAQEVLAFADAAKMIANRKENAATRCRAHHPNRWQQS